MNGSYKKPVIVISNSSADPIYLQIAKQIRSQIITGVLSEGYALPSIRALAGDLQVSVITTKRAYEELEKDGYIDTVNSKGSFIAMQNPDLLRQRRMRLVEERLAGTIVEAKQLGIGRDELHRMLDLLFEEDV